MKKLAILFLGVAFVMPMSVGASDLNILRTQGNTPVNKEGEFCFEGSVEYFMVQSKDEPLTLARVAQYFNVEIDEVSLHQSFNSSNTLSTFIICTPKEELEKEQEAKEQTLLEVTRQKEAEYEARIEEEKVENVEAQKTRAELLTLIVELMKQVVELRARIDAM